MARKKELPPDGSPAYMAMYSGLMTIMLAFFILLNTLAVDQDAGFKEGIGQVRDAFGVNGGYGLMNYMQMVRGRSKVRTTKEAKPGELAGTPKDQTIGQGGAGNVDQDTDEYTMDSYIQVRVNFDFPRGSSRIPDEMAKYLDSIGTSMQLFDYAISVKCACNETGNDDHDRRIATKRATTVMLYLQRRSQMDIGSMRATGYTTTNFFASPDKVVEWPLDDQYSANDKTGSASDHEIPRKKQLTFLCIYRKAKANQ